MKKQEEKITVNCPKCGEEIDNIKGLLKKTITLLNSQELFFKERYLLE